MRVACVVAEHLEVQVERCRDARLGNKPVIVGGRPWESKKVLDCSKEAESLGVYEGMSLRQAEQICPWAIFLCPDHRAYEKAQNAVREALWGFSPVVEMAGRGVGYVEVSGLGGLYGTEKEIGQKIVVQAGSMARLETKVGIASNKFTSLVAAEVAPMGTVVVVPLGNEARFLADLPLWHLPYDDEDSWELLHRLGVYTMGGLVALGRNAVIRRLRGSVAHLYDLARGIDPSPIIAEREPLRIEERVAFEDGIAEYSQLESALRSLVDRGAGRLESMRRLCRGLRVEVGVSFGMRVGKSLSLKWPYGCFESLWETARDVLRGLEISGEVGELVLVLFPLVGFGEGSRQEGLFDLQGQRRELVEETLASLRERWGDEVVQPARVVEPPAPLPIEATADEVGYPRTLSWGGSKRRVEEVSEHWREAGQWWRQEIVRDYYRILVAGGQMMVVFRDGIDGGWYLERRHLPAA